MSETHLTTHHADDFVLKCGDLYFDHFDWDAGRPVGHPDPHSVPGFATLEEAQAEAKMQAIVDGCDVAIVRRKHRPTVVLTDAGREAVAARRAARLRERG